MDASAHLPSDARERVLAHTGSTRGVCPVRHLARGSRQRAAWVGAGLQLCRHDRLRAACRYAHVHARSVETNVCVHLNMGANCNHPVRTHSRLVSYMPVEYVVPNARCFVALFCCSRYNNDGKERFVDEPVGKRDRVVDVAAWSAAWGADVRRRLPCKVMQTQENATSRINRI